MRRLCEIDLVGHWCCLYLMNKILSRFVVYVRPLLILPFSDPQV